MCVWVCTYVYVCMHILGAWCAPQRGYAVWIQRVWCSCQNTLYKVWQRKEAEDFKCAEHAFVRLQIQLSYIHTPCSRPFIQTSLICLHCMAKVCNTFCFCWFLPHSCYYCSFDDVLDICVFPNLGQQSEEDLSCLDMPQPLCTKKTESIDKCFSPVWGERIWLATPHQWLNGIKSVQSGSKIWCKAWNQNSVEAVKVVNDKFSNYKWDSCLGVHTLLAMGHVLSAWI